MSIQRQMKRARQRANPDLKVEHEQPTRTREGRGKGYEVLHVTKGWRGVAVLRLAAGKVIAAILGRALPARRRRVPKGANIYRYQKRREPADVPSRVTRQQRRFAHRKGIAL